LVEEEVGIFPGDVHRCVWEHKLPADRQASGVVRVDVGDEDVVDLLGPAADSGECVADVLAARALGPGLTQPNPAAHAIAGLRAFRPQRPAR
jgi:hypothetical protein